MAAPPAGKGMSMNRFTVAQNIARFEKILATTTDSGLIGVVEKLLKLERRLLGPPAPPLTAVQAAADAQPSRRLRTGLVTPSTPAER